MRSVETQCATFRAQELQQQNFKCTRAPNRGSYKDKCCYKSCQSENSRSTSPCEEKPLLISFDFAAAFPFVAWAWVWTVLRAMSLTAVCSNCTSLSTMSMRPSHLASTFRTWRLESSLSEWSTHPRQRQTNVWISMVMELSVRWWRLCNCLEKRWCRA